MTAEVSDTVWVNVLGRESQTWIAIRHLSLLITVFTSPFK